MISTPSCQFPQLAIMFSKLSIMFLKLSIKNHITDCNIFFLQHNNFINYLGVAYNIPRSHLFLIPPRTTLPSFCPPQIKKNGEKKYTKFNLLFPYIHWNMVKFPVSSLLKIVSEFFLTLLPETIRCEEPHFNIFITVFKESLQWFPV